VAISRVRAAANIRVLPFFNNGDLPHLLRLPHTQPLIIWFEKTFATRVTSGGRGGRQGDGRGGRRGRTTTTAQRREETIPAVRTAASKMVEEKGQQRNIRRRTEDTTTTATILPIKQHNKPPRVVYSPLTLS
jgi:hypothetical protein